MATDHQPDSEMGEPGDGHQRQGMWDQVEKVLPFIAFAMEGQDLDTRIFALLMVVLVIRAMAAPPGREK